MQYNAIPDIFFISKFALYIQNQAPLNKRKKSSVY